MKSIELEVGQVILDRYGNSYTVELFDKLVILDEPEKENALDRLRYEKGEYFLEEQIDKGIEVEKEHCEDEDIAFSIARDHLIESPCYYIELEKMEKKLKE